jgi:hypothetical protein
LLLGTSVWYVAAHLLWVMVLQSFSFAISNEVVVGAMAATHLGPQSKIIVV